MHKSTILRIILVCYSCCVSNAVIVADGTQVALPPNLYVRDALALDDDLFAISSVDWDTNKPVVLVYDRALTIVNTLICDRDAIGYVSYPKMIRVTSTQVLVYWSSVLTEESFNTAVKTIIITNIAGINWMVVHNHIFVPLRFSVLGYISWRIEDVRLSLGNYTTSPDKILVAWSNDNNSPMFKIYNVDGSLSIDDTAIPSNSYTVGNTAVATAKSDNSWVWFYAWSNSNYAPGFVKIYPNGTHSSINYLCCAGDNVSAAGSVFGNLWGILWVEQATSKVRAQFFDGALNNVSNPGYISTLTNCVSETSLRPLPDGTFIAGWSSQGAYWSPYGNVLDGSAGSVLYPDDIKFPNTSDDTRLMAVDGFRNGTVYQYLALWNKPEFKVGVFPLVVPASASPTPSVTSSITPSISVSKSPSMSSSITPSISSSKSPSRTPSITPSTSKSPSRTPSVTPSISTSKSPSVSSSVTPSIGASKSPSPAPASPSSSTSISPSATATPSTSPSLSAAPSLSTSPALASVSATPTSSMTTSASLTPSTPTVASSSKTPSIGSSSSIPPTTISPSSSPSTDSIDSKKSSNNVALAAGIVGGAVGLAVLALIAFFVIRKRSRHQPAEAHLEMSTGGSSDSQPQKNDTIDNSEIEVGAELGRGAFGIVHKCVWRETDCVVKFLHSSASASVVENFIREAQHAKNLRNHPNICTIFGVCSDPVGIVMEYVSGGSLLSCLANNKITLSPHKVVKFAKDVASGMNHLHAENIIHLDLACRNLLVSLGANDVQQIKITDFGLSRVLVSNQYKASAESTFPVRWTAPETLSLGLVSRASDVWSFAVTIWEIIECKIPYKDMTNEEVINYVSSGQRLPRPTKVEIPDEFWNLMLRCWSQNAEDRPSFKEICVMLKQIENQFKQESNETELEDTNTVQPNQNNPAMSTYDKLRAEEENKKSDPSSSYGNAIT